VKISLRAQADSKSKPRDLYRSELVRNKYAPERHAKKNITKVIPSEEEQDKLAIRRAIF